MSGLHGEEVEADQSMPHAPGQTIHRQDRYDHPYSSKVQQLDSFHIITTRNAYYHRIKIAIRAFQETFELKIIIVFTGCLGNGRMNAYIITFFLRDCL